MGKHAYLIIAHGDWSMLSKLLRTLDDPRNDIYLHVDIKAEFHPESLYQPIWAKLITIPRMNVTWGGDSQVKCEMALLKAAAEGHYAYYHLLSGADLPLRSQNEIHRFFDSQYGRNFIKIDARAVENGSAEARVRRYLFFQNQTGRKEGVWVELLQTIERISLYIQRKLGVDRLKNCPKKIYKGSNWFSITDAMVQVVLSEENFIRKYCYYGISVDEVFLQTVAMNSPLRDTVADEYLRHIDWERGCPYVFRSDDYEELIASTDLFARKFSDDVDPNITARIVNEVTNFET